MRPLTLLEAGGFVCSLAYARPPGIVGAARSRGYRGPMPSRYPFVDNSALISAAGNGLLMR